MTAVQPHCDYCDSTGWVCEKHTKLPSGIASTRWDACICSPGVPCGACNPCGDEDEPPRDPPGYGDHPGGAA